MPTSMQIARRPAQMPAGKHVHERERARILVTVRKEMKPWRRVEFFIYLADQMAAHQPPVPDLQSLADMARINSSTFSKWKSGKTRPTIATLYAIAEAFGLPKAEVVSKAGILDDDDQRRPGMAAGLDPNIQRIRDSRLAPVYQQKLIDQYLADRAAAEERVKQGIELLESATTPSP